MLKDMSDCSFSSLQFDESLDVMDTVQLVVSTRMVFQDCTTEEEFFPLLEESTGGEDIHNKFKKIYPQ